MARKRKPPSVQGEPRTYDPDFHGPTDDRYCTDVVCCVVFILFIMGYIVLGLVAWSHGDPRRLAYPTDSKGHYCGQKFTPNENKPVLFYFNVFKCTTSASMMLRLQCPTTQICVSKCPEKFLTYIEMQSLNKNDKNFWDYYRQFCKSTAKPVETLSEILTHYDCPTAVFPSRPFLQRCFPDFSSTNGTLTIGSKLQFDDGRGNSRSAMELRDASNGMSEILDTKIFWLKVFEDYVVAWKWIIIALTIAMVLSWMFLILLRFTAGFLFWVFMFGVLGIIGYGIWYCYVEYNGLQKKPYSTLTVYNFGIPNNISAFYYLKQTWFFLMIFLSVLEAVIILMLIFLRKRIRVAIILLKEGSKAIGYIPSTLVYPILTVILLSICLSYWAVTAVFLSTSGEPVFKVLDPERHCSHEGETCDPEIFDQTDIPKVCPGALCNFAFYGGNGVYHKYITTFQLYNLFAFFWLINFVIALDQCTLAGAFASYYWATRKPDDIPPRPVFTAFGRAVRYHTGSLAFGSLILALTQMFKVIIEYVDRRLKNIQNAFSRFIRCCLKCCFWCFDAVVKFLNRNAYIMIAIYGKSFCESTRNAFSLLMRNILKVAVTDEVTFFVLLLGKMLVSGIVGILAFLLFTERLPKIIEGPTSLNYYWVPLLTIVCGSYLIAHGFFSVYSMCIETIFICFCDDLERNDGSSEKPYFITPTLHGILTKKHPVPPKQSRKAPSSTAHFQV